MGLLSYSYTRYSPLNIIQYMKKFISKIKAQTIKLQKLNSIYPTSMQIISKKYVIESFKN